VGKYNNYSYKLVRFTFPQRHLRHLRWTHRYFSLPPFTLKDARSVYIYTLIIGHKSCNQLSILNKLTLQKKLQNCMTKNVLLDKQVKTKQQQNKK